MKKVLRNKEARPILENIGLLYGDLGVSKRPKIEIDDNIILIDNEAKFFYYKDKIVPVLKLILEKNFLKKITVDMGAVKFVANGADIMRPGITSIEEGIQKESIVSIVDETHKKPLAVGLALFDGEEMRKMDSGKVIKTLHYVGDNIWNYQG
jgi:PUA domain protein